MKLKKFDLQADSNAAMNVETYFNENWDKVDEKFQSVENICKRKANANHTHQATSVNQDATHLFTTETEKTAWNSKAEGEHRHGIEDIDFKTFDFYVEGDADTYYPVVISNISNEYYKDFFTRRRLEIVRYYFWEAPNSWYAETHKGGLQVYIDTHALGWGGMHYPMDIIMGQQYTTMVADIKIVEPATSIIIVWLRGGYARYKIVAEDTDMTVQVYHEEFLYKPRTEPEYWRRYVPRTTVEEGLNFIGLRRFNATGEQYIQSGFRAPYAGNKIVTTKELDEVKQSVSDGKNRLETAIADKGGTVSKSGGIATFDELINAINTL